MRFTCDDRREYDTEDFERIYTGDDRVPLALVMRRNRRVVLVVEKGPSPPEVTVRRANQAELAELTGGPSPGRERTRGPGDPRLRP